MKRKNLKTTVLILGLAFILTGCSKQENKETDENMENVDSIADKGLETAKAPKGCELVKDSQDFYPVKEEQAYNEETDCNNGIRDSDGIDSVGNMVYYLRDNCLYIYDKEAGSFGILCAKPDCMHNTSECNAFVYGGQHGGSIDVYQKEIYTIVESDLASENRTAFDLIKISADGFNREKVKTLLSMEKSANTASAVRWILHRGYIYYIYEAGNGYTKDAYYLNGSNCIYRCALDESSEPECIMALEFGMDKGYIKLKAAGSYIYFILPETADTGMLHGQLYRYNTESNKVECVSEAGYIADYAVIGEDIIFKKLENPHQIWKYETSSNSAVKLFETDNSIGICYNDVYADKNYIYNVYSNEDESQIIYAVYDYNGNYIGKFQREWECYFMGMDEENFYFYSDEYNDDSLAGTNFYSLSKERISIQEAEITLIGTTE